MLHQIVSRASIAEGKFETTDGLCNKVLSLKKTPKELQLIVQPQYSVQKYVAESLSFRRVAPSLQKIKYSF